MKAIVYWALDRTARWLIQHPGILIGGIAVYVIMPVDLLPEAFLGPIGYIDDAFMMLVPFLLKAYVRRHPVPKSRPARAIDTTAE